MHDQVPAIPVRSQTAQAATDFAARSRERNCQSRRCPPAFRERTGAEARFWWDSSRRFRTKPGSRKLTGGGVRCHLRGPVLSRVFWTCQARRSGADSESCENSQGEAQGSRGVSRKQGAQGFERPRRRSMVLAQTRRCLPVAAVRRLPEPQAVRRHDRCGPRRGKVWKPAASKCSASPHYVVLEPASQDPSHETEWGWPILGIQDPEGRLLPPGPPAEQSAVVVLPQGAGRLGCSAQELGASASTASETSASVAAHFEKEIQAEFDRRNAKGGKRTGGKKGAQGEE